MTDELHVVAAVAKDLCIGKGGALPWRLPEDLKHFKALTVGHAIVMGRKTFDSIGKALPERTSIVISSRDPSTFPPGVIVCASLDDALARARAIDVAPRVIGGGEVYREAMALATHLHITHVDIDVPDGDTYFPPIDPCLFTVRARRHADTPGVVFVEYQRRG